MRSFPFQEELESSEQHPPFRLLMFFTLGALPPLQLRDPASYPQLGFEDQRAKKQEQPEIRM